MKYCDLVIGMSCVLDGEACTIVDVYTVNGYIAVQINDDVDTFLWGFPDKTITQFER